MVFCLSEEQRPRLAQAAATLELVEPGSIADRVRVDGREIELVDWRALRREDFERSCTALVNASHPPPPSGVANTLIATVNVMVGAVIGFLSARWQDRVVRSGQQARALHAANSAFVAVAESYLRKWTTQTPERPSDTVLYESRFAVEGELRAVQAIRPRWTAPEQILSAFANSFDERISTGWDLVDRTERVRQADVLRNEFRQLTHAVDKVVRALESVFIPHPEMRRQLGHLLRGAAR